MAASASSRSRSLSSVIPRRRRTPPRRRAEVRPRRCLARAESSAGPLALVPPAFALTTPSPLFYRHPEEARRQAAREKSQERVDNLASAHARPTPLKESKRQPLSTFLPFQPQGLWTVVSVKSFISQIQMHDLPSLKKPTLRQGAVSAAAPAARRRRARKSRPAPASCPC